ncbi:hypothetical protein TNCV_2364401 [Trichonephila clavipes]|nr:hypothetical protein TNCV_2364401 [Trichonephila clavipes]
MVKESKNVSTLPRSKRTIICELLKLENSEPPLNNWKLKTGKSVPFAHKILFPVFRYHTYSVGAVAYSEVHGHIPLDHGQTTPSTLKHLWKSCQVDKTSIRNVSEPIRVAQESLKNIIRKEEGINIFKVSGLGSVGGIFDEGENQIE